MAPPGSPPKKAPVPQKFIEPVTLKASPFIHTTVQRLARFAMLFSLLISGFLGFYLEYDLFFSPYILYVLIAINVLFEIIPFLWVTKHRKTEEEKKTLISMVTLSLLFFTLVIFAVAVSSFYMSDMLSPEAILLIIISGLMAIGLGIVLAGNLAETKTYSVDDAPTLVIIDYASFPDQHNYALLEITLAHYWTQDVEIFFADIFTSSPSTSLIAARQARLLPFLPRNCQVQYFSGTDINHVMRSIDFHARYGVQKRYLCCGKDTAIARQEDLESYKMQYVVNTNKILTFDQLKVYSLDEDEEEDEHEHRSTCSFVLPEANEPIYPNQPAVPKPIKSPAVKPPSAGTPASLVIARRSREAKRQGPKDPVLQDFLAHLTLPKDLPTRLREFCVAMETHPKKPSSAIVILMIASAFLEREGYAELFEPRLGKNAVAGKACLEYLAVIEDGKWFKQASNIAAAANIKLDAEASLSFLLSYAD